MPAKKPAVKTNGTKPNLGYFQNKEGRVFIGTREIAKQARTNKFGLTKITKGVFDEAMSNKGLTEPLVDLDEDDGE